MVYNGSTYNNIPIPRLALGTEQQLLFATTLFHYSRYNLLFDNLFLPSSQIHTSLGHQQKFDRYEKYLRSTKLLRTLQKFLTPK